MTIEIPYCEQPIFVIGSPRSGTTALAFGLAKHSALWTSHESYVLHDLFGRGRLVDAFQRYKEREESPSWVQTQDVDLEEFSRYLGLGLNALYTSRSGRCRWIEHTVLYTRMAEELGALFPTAQFIHIVRDGRRVVHSMSNMLSRYENRSKGAKYLPKWASDFRSACRTWQETVEAAEVFRARYSERCLLVFNERVLAEPHQECARIFDFLGVENEPGPAQALQRTSGFSSFEFVSSAQKEAAREAWTSWSRDQRRIFTREAGDTIVALGYLTADELDAWMRTRPTRVKR